MNTVAAPRQTKNIPLGTLLIEQGILKPEQLSEALEDQKRTGHMLGRVLVENGFVTEEQIGRVLAGQLKVPFIDLRRYEVQSEIVRRIPEIQARRLRALVLEDRGDTYLVGFVDAFDLRSQDDVAAQLKKPIDIAIITNEQLIETIDRIYRKTEQITEFAREVERDVDVVDLNRMDLELTDEDAPVVKMLRSVFEDATQINASDIHVEPQEKKLLVRFRIDGVLHIQAEADPRIASALMVRLKLMAGLDIAEKRLPQDGRIAIRAGTHKLDVRMSTMPTQWGESVVMRLLRQDIGPVTLESSGMPEALFRRFDKLIQAPHGIILVTGPTGSGKTTTLYGALQRLNSPNVKILTCEDPVEYRIEGINQVQVNEKIELTFARVLRSFLRQDPDILLVGEIRDQETAAIAARAAMTGHLVLSTLHTNDAVSTPGRLLDMGVPGYMIASTLLGVLSQRLLRLNCTYCTEPYTPSSDELEWVKHYLEGDLSQVQFHRGKGCSRCNGIGFSGRTGVFEMLEMTEPLAAALHQGDARLFETEAKKQMGDESVSAEALRLVLDGHTSVAEAMQVVSSMEV